jgi:predicted NBD/HSP70 family sugar kinase
VEAAFLTASSPRRIRQRNEVAALQALYQSGPMSRADLARALRLNRSSAGHIIAALAADGLVRETDEATPEGGYARAGRPGVELELVAEARSFLGIEIGVEHISVAEIDLSARLVRTEGRPFAGAGAGMKGAVASAFAFARQAVPKKSFDRCEGIGVCAPAHIDSAGYVRAAPLLGWRGVRLSDAVRSASPVSAATLVENDANAFAFGAAYRRSALRSGVTLCLVMESGLGGGVILEGKLFRGAHGVAGEIGHLIMSSEGESHRSLEQAIGLGAVLDRYARVATRAPTLASLLADVTDGHSPAVAIAEDWARSLAFGLSQTCRIVDADRIVLGGSLAALYRPMERRVMDAMRGFQDVSFPLPEILVEPDGGTGPAFGAACLMHQRYLSLQSQRLSDAEEES